ncbi:hypothetical protein JNUCC74_12705 [Cerasibacillus sp. JNUCC 74]
MSKFVPSKYLRIIVVAVITGLAFIMMRIGGLPPLEIVSGLMGIPIIIVQFLAIFAVKKMIDKDKVWRTNIRN